MEVNNSNYENVKRFHEVFNCPIANTPAPLDNDRLLIRLSWIAEELVEALHGSAYSNEEFDELYSSLITKMESTYQREYDKQLSENDFERLISQIDSFCDTDYFNNGNSVEIGVAPNPIHQIVHNSNMSKLDENNKPIFNEFGKVIKSHLFVPPEPLIKAEVLRQLERSNQL